MSQEPENFEDDVYKSYASIERSRAYNSRTYIDIENNRSVRPSYTRKTYTSFRQSESVPSKQKEIIKMSMEAYDNVGLIRHIIDLMGDFASQGMSIVHEDKSEEKFYKRWFKEVSGQERSERFLNYFYRTGNVIVRRTFAKITPKETRDFKSKGAGENFQDPKVSKRRIPWSYEFLNPLVIDFVKETPFSNEKPKLIMNLSGNTYNSLNNNVKYLSNEMRRNIKRGHRQVPLDMKTVRTFHYKKDDWLLWANPMIRPILDDILMLEKMKLADLAALDGAISNVRLWTLGDLEHKILPKKPAVNKLRDVLASNVGGGTMDLIWGPDLKFTESSSQVYKFLGNEKYQPVLNSIYVGMGIPPALTGGSGSGLTNNHLSLKTLIERLEYGRSILLSFWEYELKLVQKAMGFSKPPQIHFTNIILSDEAAVRKLLIDLTDRNIISEETLLERFNEIPEIEKVRVGRENKERIAEPTSVKKAGPYHNPHYPEDMAKVGITRDVVNIKEYFDKLGIPSKKPSAIPAGPGQTQQKKPNLKNPDGGRPKNTRDTNPRKQRRVIPRSQAGDSMIAWAISAQKQISEAMTPIALSHYNKKNLRSLNKNEFDELEYLKLCILTGMEPYMDIDADTINLILKNNKRPSNLFKETVAAYKENFINHCQKEPSLEDLRVIYAIVFTEINRK